MKIMNLNKKHLLRIMMLKISYKDMFFKEVKENKEMKNYNGSTKTNELIPKLVII